MDKGHCLLCPLLGPRDFQFALAFRSQAQAGGVCHQASQGRFPASLLLPSHLLT